MGLCRECLNFRATLSMFFAHMLCIATHLMFLCSCFCLKKIWLVIDSILENSHCGLFCRFNAHFSFCNGSCGFYTICSRFSMIFHSFKMVLSGQIWQLLSIFGSFLSKFAPCKRCFDDKFDTFSEFLLHFSYQNCNLQKVSVFTNLKSFF